MLVGLYTSRVVLATLGVEDYGIYGVVGGIVAMMGFLNASMAGATSRFLTFELGRGNHERLAKTFSSALIIHVGIALVVLIVAETAGLWFLSNKLVIPESRMSAAHWVYQLSIASAMLGITQVPYNATIIAHEKMDVYAYVEILNVTLKLLIVYLLTIGHFDKLILYAWLMFGASLFIMMLYRIYSIRHFEEARFHWIWDKTYLKPILSFSGWNIFGNMGNIVSQHGTNFVINVFWGVAMNAAVGIGLTVSGIVNSFSGNIMIAFRPQITKTYAVGDIEAMQRITLLALKVILLIYALVAVPIFLESEYILKLWLVKPPEFSSVFCKILLVSIFFETMRYILVMDMHASGNVKFTSAISGTALFIVPLVVYLLYYEGLDPEWAFYTFVFANIFLSIANFFLVKHYVKKIEIKKYVASSLQVILICAFVLFATTFIQGELSTGFFRLILMFLCSSVLLVSLSFTFCLDKGQRVYVIQFIKSKLHVA